MRLTSGDRRSRGCGPSPGTLAGPALQCQRPGLQQILTEAVTDSVVRPPGTRACTHTNARSKAQEDRADGSGWLVEQSQRHEFFQIESTIHCQVTKNEECQNSIGTSLDTRTRERGHARIPFLHRCVLSRITTLSSVGNSERKRQTLTVTPRDWGTGGATGASASAASLSTHALEVC